MSSLFQLVCQLYQVMSATVTVKVNKLRRSLGRRRQNLGINLLLSCLTLFSGGEASDLHRRSGQTGQERLLKQRHTCYRQTYELTANWRTNMFDVGSDISIKNIFIQLM